MRWRLPGARAGTCCHNLAWPSSYPPPLPILACRPCLTPSANPSQSPSVLPNPFPPCLYIQAPDLPSWACPTLPVTSHPCLSLSITDVPCLSLSVPAVTNSQLPLSVPCCRCLPLPTLTGRHQAKPSRLARPSAGRPGNPSHADTLFRASLFYCCGTRVDAVHVVMWWGRAFFLLRRS